MKIMNRNIKDRLYIATVCAEHREIISKYDIGAELDQFCQAEKMDAPLHEDACEEIAELLERQQKKRCVWGVHLGIIENNSNF